MGKRAQKLATGGSLNDEPEYGVANFEKICKCVRLGFSLVCSASSAPNLDTLTHPCSLDLDISSLTLACPHPLTRTRSSRRCSHSYTCLAHRASTDLSFMIASLTVLLITHIAQTHTSLPHWHMHRRAHALLSSRISTSRIRRAHLATHVLLTLPRTHTRMHLATTPTHLTTHATLTHARTHTHTHTRTRFVVSGTFAPSCRQS
jgi:hypothetical protein